MILHYVAVDACSWIAAQIAPAFAIAEGKRAHSDEDANHNCQQAREDCSARKPSRGCSGSRMWGFSVSHDAPLSSGQRWLKVDLVCWRFPFAVPGSIQIVQYREPFLG
jgi:hypothetical protein